MSTLQDRTQALRDDAKRVRDIFTGATVQNIANGLVGLSHAVRRCLRAAMDLERRDALREKELIDLRMRVSALEHGHDRL